MTRRSRFIAPLSLMVALVALATPVGAQVGAWTPLAQPAPVAMSTMLLLTDGSVMGQESFGTRWYRLTPDAAGSYVNGTWTQLASMNDTRLYYFSVVLRDGRVLIGGGEYGTGATNVERYDPATNAWTRITSWTHGDISDSTGMVLADGRVLLLPRLDASGWIYDPVADTWTRTAAKLNGDINDEESAVLMPNGDIMLADVWDPPNSQRYVVASDTWVTCGAIPANMVDGAREIGPGLLLYDGRIIHLGATGNTNIYTPGAGAGSWVQGPTIPNGTGATPMCCDDAPGALMPDGRVLFAADSGGFANPTAMFEFDPVAGAMSAAPSPSLSFTFGPAYINRMLMLPNGQVLMSTGSPSVFAYTPAGSTDPSWRPAISTIVDNGDGSFQLSGTQLNGLSVGAAYGDDATMASNYPIVRLVDTGGQVVWGRTSGFSTMAVATGSASVSTSFRIPTVRNGAYALSVIANGISSASVPFTVARAQAAPQITSTAVTAGAVGVFYDYTVTSSGSPAPVLSLSAGPTGMTLDSATGYLTWTPPAPGFYQVTVVATNGVAPDAVQTFTIAVPGPPFIVSTPVTSAAVGQPYTYAVISGDPPAATFSLDTAPAGMSIGGASGIITWTPGAIGTVPVVVRASNGLAPDATQSFSIIVNQAPLITSAAVTTVRLGQTYAYTATAIATPAPTFTLPVHPVGMTINGVTGAISWTPTSEGFFAVTVAAANGIAPSTSQSFIVTVQTPPALTSATVTTARVDDLYQHALTASGTPAPTFTLVSGPPGLSIDALTGLISWTPGAVGSFTVIVSVDNGVPPADTVSFVIEVAPALATSQGGTRCGFGATLGLIALLGLGLGWRRR